MTDQLHNFMLNEGEYRGTLVQLSHSYQQIIQLHQYPLAISQLLGEALAAISLFGHNIKQTGKLALQLQGHDFIHLLLVEMSGQGEIRGLVQWDDEVSIKCPLYLNEGQLAITLTPIEGERHQGIVPIIGGTLAESLTYYFGQSEQIFSRLILCANEHQAAGIFLQKMPAFEETEFKLSVEEAHLLISTLQPQELFKDTAAELLHKLFYEHDVTLFETQAVQFKCQCSHEKMASAVQLLGFDDAMDLLITHKKVTVTCEFCNQHYDFDNNEVRALFTENSAHGAALIN